MHAAPSERAFVRAAAALWVKAAAVQLVQQGIVNGLARVRGLPLCFKLLKEVLLVSPLTFRVRCHAAQCLW